MNKRRIKTRIDDNWRVDECHSGLKDGTTEVSKRHTLLFYIGLDKPIRGILRWDEGNAVEQNLATLQRQLADLFKEIERGAVKKGFWQRLFEKSKSDTEDV